MPEAGAARVVLLTGAGSGFGRLAARRFADQGDTLALCDVNDSALHNLAGELGREHLMFPCDVSKAAQLDRFIDAVIERFGRIDVAVNNAGIAHEQRPLADCDDELWSRVLEVNLTGVFLCMKREIRQMLEQGTGMILNIASVAGVLGAPMLGPYCASKHGVVGLTRTAAVEYGRKGVRVNALCPGYSPTPLVAGMLRAGDEGMESRMTDRIPLKRMAQPDEVVDAILWLCSEQNSFMNGASIVLDGGLTAC